MILHRTLLTIISMLPLATQAQTYHDAANEQIVGHAKSVTYNRSATLETFQFDKEGRIHDKDISHVLYDKQGWMKSCTTLYMGHPAKMTVSYDAEHRVSCQKLELGSSYLLEEFAYANGPCPQKYTVTICYRGVKHSLTTTYSQYQFDAHGSWTSRAATTDSYTSYETRSILYWE